MNISLSLDCSFLDLSNDDDDNSPSSSQEDEPLDLLLLPLPSKQKNLSSTTNRLIYDNQFNHNYHPFNSNFNLNDINLPIPSTTTTTIPNPIIDQPPSPRRRKYPVENDYRHSFGLVTISETELHPPPTLEARRKTSIPNNRPFHVQPNRSSIKLLSLQPNRKPSSISSQLIHHSSPSSASSSFSSSSTNNTNTTNTSSSSSSHEPLNIIRTSQPLTTIHPNHPSPRSKNTIHLPSSPLTKNDHFNLNTLPSALYLSQNLIDHQLNLSL